MFKVLATVGFFSHFWHQLVIMFLSCVPIIESRYAITIGMLMYKDEMSTLELFILSQIAAFCVALILLFLAENSAEETLSRIGELFLLLCLLYFLIQVVCVKIFGVKLLAALLSRLILIVSIESYVSNEVVDLRTLKG